MNGKHILDYPYGFSLSIFWRLKNAQMFFSVFPEREAAASVILKGAYALYSATYVWAKVLAHLEERYTEPVISAWFDDAEVVKLTDDTLTIYTPSDYRKDVIKRRGAAYVKDAMEELFHQQITLVVLTKAEYEAQKQAEKEAALPGNSTFFQLNPQFTFERFVVGSSNRFPHAAALSVASTPSETYNPLLIYGPSGLGKTHLLYAIANRVHQDHPDFKIVYVKGEQFTNELIESVRTGKMADFRERYRKNADLFLMDDIQFIAGKESTQEEFFNTFNELWENKKQIVLTSDRPPKDMPTLEDRIRTRIEWGLLAGIQAPDYETRMAIIQNKAQELGLELSDDICSFIAENITNNVRQIEGTIKKIQAHHDLDGMPLDLQNVKRAIQVMFKEGGSNLPTVDLIISEVGRFYSIDTSVLRSTLKNRNTAEARQVAMYLIRSLTGLSLPDIGREFGRDHSTVIHAIKKIEQQLSTPGSGLETNLRDITASINDKL